MAYNIPLEKWNGLEIQEASNEALKGLVQFEYLVEEQKFHRPRPPTIEGTPALLEAL
jgi:hypothetical protein